MKTYAEFIVLALAAEQFAQLGGQLLDLAAGLALFGVFGAEAASHTGDTQKSHGRLGDGIDQRLFIQKLFIRQIESNIWNNETYQDSLDGLGGDELGQRQGQEPAEGLAFGNLLLLLRSKNPQLIEKTENSFE